MKTHTSIRKSDIRTVTILAALTAGLGFVVHKVFFAFAAAIALSVPFGRFIDSMREEERKAHATPS